MNRTLFRLMIIMVLGGLGVCLAPLPSGVGGAFVVGQALFAINLLLLLVGARRLLGLHAASTEQKSKRSQALLGLGMGAKVFMLGGGAYLALVVAKLRADGFTAGLCFSLIALGLLVYVEQVKRGPSVAH